MTANREYRTALQEEDQAKLEKSLTREDIDGARTAIEKNFGIHAAPLPCDQFTGSFSEHGDRAWAHRLLARHAAGDKKPLMAVKLARAALKLPK